MAFIYFCRRLAIFSYSCLIGYINDAICETKGGCSCGILTLRPGHVAELQVETKMLKTAGPM